MSVVTNIIFTFSVNESYEKTIDKIDEYLIAKYFTKLVSIRDAKLPDKWYGGHKYFETELYLAAINAFDEKDFFDFIAKLGWEEPEFVQLIVKRDGEDKFSIVHMPGY
jgi:hypothetical protein